MGKPGKELFHGGGLRVSSLVARIAHDAEDSVGGCQVHGLFQGRQSGIRTGDEVPVPAGQVAQVEHDCFDRAADQFREARVAGQMETDGIRKQPLFPQAFPGGA